MDLQVTAADLKQAAALSNLSELPGDSTAARVQGLIKLLRFSRGQAAVQRDGMTLIASAVNDPVAYPLLVSGGAGAAVAATFVGGDSKAQEAALSAMIALSLPQGDGAQKLYAAGALRSVISAMKKPRASQRLQTDACALLAVVASQPASHTGLRDGGACEALAAVLLARPSIIAIGSAVCSAMVELASDDDPDCRSRFGAAGGCKAILSFMAAHTDAAAVKLQLALCATLACDKRNSQRLESGGAAAAYRRAMLPHKQDEEVQEEGCRATEILARGSPGREQLVKEGMCEMVGRAMECHPDCDGVQNAAARAIVELASADGAVPRLSAAGACEALVGALLRFPMHQELQWHCCMAIGRLVSLDASNRRRLGVAGACMAIVATMVRFEDDDNAQSSGLFALVDLALDPINRLELVKAGAAGAAVRAINRYKEHDVLARTGLDLLANLALEATLGPPSLMRADAGECIVATMDLHTDTADVQNAGCRAIANLVGHPPDKAIAEKLGRCTAANAIVQALQSATVLSQAGLEFGCIAIVRLAANSSSNHDRLRDAGACEVLASAAAVYLSRFGIADTVLDAFLGLVKNDRLSVKRLGTAPSCCNTVVAALLAGITTQAADPRAELLTALGCQVLSALCMVRAGANRRMFVAGGACNAVNVALFTFTDKPHVQARGCEAVLRLAISSQGREALETNGAGKAVALVLKRHPDNAEVQKWGRAAAYMLEADPI